MILTRFGASARRIAVDLIFARASRPLVRSRWLIHYTAKRGRSRMIAENERRGSKLAGAPEAGAGQDASRHRRAVFGSPRRRSPVRAARSGPGQRRHRRAGGPAPATAGTGTARPAPGAVGGTRPDRPARGDGSRV